MAKIEVEGLGVIYVPDTFKSLSKEEKQRYVNQIAKSGAQRERKKIKPKDDGDDGYAANLARMGAQGLLLGFGDEMEAGLRTGFGFAGDYKKTRDDIRENIDDFRAANPKTALAAEIGGGLLTGGYGGARAAGTALGKKLINKVGTAGFGGTVGATEGAIAGIGSGRDTSERITGGITGGTLGGVLGSSAPLAINAVGKGLNRAAYTLGLKSDDAIQRGADLKALQALENANTTPAAVQQSLDDAVVPNMMIPDVAGEATRKLARGSATVSGEGADIAQKALDDRMAGLGDDIADDIGGTLGTGQSASQALDEIIERQSKNAQRDFDRAFFGQKIVNDADGNITVVQSDQPTRIFDNFGDMLDRSSFKSAYRKAQKIASDEGQPMPSLEALKKSSKMRDVDQINEELFEELATAKSGTTYSQIETLSELRKANDPQFVAAQKANPKISKLVDLFDEAAEAKLSRYPLTLKQAHYIKMGMDAAIDSGKRSGSLSNTEQGLAKKLRTAFKERLFDQSESYKLANENFAGDAALRDALDAGQKFAKGSSENIQGLMSDMTASERSVFKIGVAQAIKDNIEKAGDMADAGKRIFGSPAKRKQLRAAFDDDASFEAFEKRMTQRASQVKTRARTAPTAGSRTAPLQEDVANLGQDASAVGQLLMGNPLPTARSIFERATTRGGMPEQIGSALSRDLFSTNRQQQREFLNRLAQRQAEEKARLARMGRRTGAYGGFIGAGSGLLTGDR